MRISDWSSDVCSSDLAGIHADRRGPAARLRLRREHGFEPEEAVREMEEQDAVGLQRPRIDAERFLRQQMERDGGRRKGVDDEDVERARGLLGESKPRVAGDERRWEENTHERK